MSQTATVYGFGLCSAFGGFKESCAAARAGVSRFSDHEHVAMMFPGDDEAEPLTIARAPEVYCGYQDVARRVKLLLSAYHDLLSQVALSELPENTHILFATPDPKDRFIDERYAEEPKREERLGAYSEKILTPFFKHSDPQLANLPMQMVFGERIAFARVIKKAEALVSEGNTCLILTVDTLLDDVMLDALAHTDRLKTGDQPTGFVPGEGAACVLIGPQKEGADVMLQLKVAFEDSSVLADMEAREEQNELDEAEDIPEAVQYDDWTAERLYTQMQSVFPIQKTDGRYPVLLSDMNGEECRSMEYGLLQVMLKRDFAVENVVEMQLPAAVFGETGGMAGVYAMALIIAAAQRGYTLGVYHQILLSEFDGRRGVIQVAVSKGNER